MDIFIYVFYAIYSFIHSFIHVFIYFEDGSFVVTILSI